MKIRSNKKRSIKASNDSRKWVNTEVSKAEWNKLRKYLKEKGYKYEPSEAGSMVHVEVQLNDAEIKEVNKFIDTLDDVDASCGKKSVKASTYNSIELTFISPDLETSRLVADKAWEIGGFGSTWSEHSWVYIDVPSEQSVDNVDDLIQYAQSVGVYLNIPSAKLLDAWADSKTQTVLRGCTEKPVKASYTYKYAVWVLDGDDNTWKCWSGKNSADLGMSEDEFLDSINHQTYPNPEYNVDNNYVDVMVIDGDKTPADYGQIEDVKEYGKIAESTRRAIKAAEGAGTVTLDNMNTDVIPVVDFGTYGGPLSYALEDVFVADYLEVDNLDPENEDEADALELINEGYDGTQDFFDQVLRLAPLYIQDAFDQYGIPAKVVSGSCKWNHPREYNYYDDTIEFSMTIDTNWVASKFAELSANEPKFADYLNENYSSRSGFISYMPNDVEGYNDILDPNSSDYWKVVSAIVMFMVYDDPSIRNDVTEDMIEYLRGNADYASLSSYGIF